MESNGFRISDTHIRDSSKIEMLFYVIAICYYLSDLAGKVKEKVGMKAEKMKKCLFSSLNMSISMVGGKRYGIKKYFNNFNFDTINMYSFQCDLCLLRDRT